MTWISEDYKDLLDDQTKAFAVLATTMEDGSPQSSPVWFNTDGKYIWINSTTERVKDHNMRRDPRIALVIIDPKDPYRYIQIRGKVVEITTEGAREHINALAKKYTGKEPYTSGDPGETRVTYKIQPDHVSY